MAIANLVIPTQCSALRLGSLVMLKGHPCKIVEMRAFSTAGEHDHPMVQLVGTDIFTERCYEILCASTHTVDVPICTRATYDILNINDEGMLELLGEDGACRSDLCLPYLCEADVDLAARIKQTWESKKIMDDIKVTVIGAMGKEAVKEMQFVKGRQ